MSVQCTISDLIIDYMILMQIIWTPLYMCVFCACYQLWRNVVFVREVLFGVFYAQSRRPPPDLIRRFGCFFSLSPSSRTLLENMTSVKLPDRPLNVGHCSAHHLSSFHHAACSRGGVLVSREMWGGGPQLWTAPTDSQQDWTENLSRWGDETQKKNVSLNQRCVFLVCWGEDSQSVRLGLICRNNQGEGC